MPPTHILEGGRGGRLIAAAGCPRQKLRPCTRRVCGHARVACAAMAAVVDDAALAAGGDAAVDDVARRR